MTPASSQEIEERIEVRRDLPGRYQLNVDTTTWSLDASRAGTWVRQAGERKLRARWTLLPGGRTLWFQRGRDWPQRVTVPRDWLPEPAVGPAIAHWLAEGSQRALRYSRLQPATGRFERVRLRQAAGFQARPAAGTPLWLELDAAAVQDAWFDSTSQVLVAALRRHGQWLRPVSCPHPCTTHLQPFVPLAALRVASPYRIPAAARHARIRYLLVSGDGPVPGLPETSEQHVVVQRSRSIATICATCGIEAAPDAGKLARLQQPNAWVQSRHPEILALLATVPRLSQATTRQRAQQLAELVRTHLDGRMELEGYADAVSAARYRGGDCTEFAVLLAALIRADGRSARVVAGLVYGEGAEDNRPQFLPHLWVQVWDVGAQRWLSIDAAAGPFGAGHLALAIGDGTPAAFRDVLDRLQRISVVAAAQLPDGRLAAAGPATNSTEPASSSSSQSPE